MNQRRKPNVVVFFTDQQRWDTVGAHGNPLNLTPNFDRIAREGTFLENMFTCQPVCSPARSCLQTGLYATSTGVFKNHLPLDENAETIARLFRSEGYHTGYIGKWHLGGGNMGFYGGQEPVPEKRRGGYQYWMAADAPEFISDAYNTVLFDKDNNEVKLPGYRVDATVDESIRFIKNHQHEPFFLFLSLLEPHHQNHTDSYPAPIGYEARYRGSWIPPDLDSLGGTSSQHLPGYYGMIKRLDEAFGRLLDAVKSLEISDNTVVLFTSDHGNHFKTRNDEYKRSCHESSVRTPAALTGPGFKGGGTIGNLISLVDMAPTLLDVAGIPAPSSMQGRSILPLVQRQTDHWPDEIFIQISESQVGRAIRNRRWKYSVYSPDSNGFEETKSQTYVEQYLYDLKYDPYELTNLVGFDSHRALSDKLKGRLLRRIQEVEKEIPEIKNADITRDPGQRIVRESEYDD